MCIAEISPGDVDLPRLTACQSYAGSGRLAAALAGFVRWLAPQMSGLHADLHTQVVAIRGQPAASGAQHWRTPGIAAELGDRVAVLPWLCRIHTGDHR